MAGVSLVKVPSHEFHCTSLNFRMSRVPAGSKPSHKSMLTQIYVAYVFITPQCAQIYVIKILTPTISLPGDCQQTMLIYHIRQRGFTLVKQDVIRYLTCFIQCANPSWLPLSMESYTLINFVICILLKVDWIAHQGREAIVMHKDVISWTHCPHH